MESETKIRVYGVPIVLMMLRGACLPSPAPYASIISTIGTGFWLNWDEEESKHKKKTLKKNGLYGLEHGSLHRLTMSYTCLVNQKQHFYVFDQLKWCKIIA